MGGTVLSVDPVTIRGPKATAAKAGKSKDIFGFRCPPHVRTYLDTASKAEGRSMSEIIVFALELDRDMGEMLQPVNERLAAFATRLGLDRSRSNDVAKLFVALINRGLLALDGETDAAAGNGTKKRK